MTMTKKLYNISYYDEMKDEELVDEVAAYSEEQALFLFNQQMARRQCAFRFIGLECVNMVGAI